MKKNHRKSIGSLFAAVALLACSFTAAPAQTITPVIPDTVPVISVLTNLPTVSFAEEKLALNIGTVMHGATSFENSISAFWNFHTNFSVGAEIQNGGNGAVVDSAGAYFKLRKPGINYEVYALMGVRRNWITGNTEGTAGIGAAYKATSSISAFCEQRLVSSFNAKQPGTETLIGVRMSF